MALGLQKPMLRNSNTDAGLRLTGLPETDGDIQSMVLWRGHFITACRLRVGYTAAARVMPINSPALTWRQDPCSQLHHQAKPKTKHDPFSLFEKTKPKQLLSYRRLFADSIRRLLGINIPVLPPQLRSMCQRTAKWAITLPGSVCSDPALKGKSCVLENWPSPGFWD